MSAADTTVPAATGTPLSSKEPLVGGASMRTPAKAWPASVSLKPKSLGCRL